MAGGQVDEVGDLGVFGSHEQLVAQQIMGMYDLPAYLRRARAVEEAQRALDHHCGRNRHELLEPTRWRLRGWLTLLRDRPSAIPDKYARQQPAVDYITAIAFLPGERRYLLAPPSTFFGVKGLWRELGQTIQRFNERWVDFMSRVDIAPINAVIDGYNRYYLIEKECALRSVRLAHAGYEPLPPFTIEHLWYRFPLMPTLE